MKKQYTSYKETMAFLEQVKSEHPNLIRIESIGETWEGRPIVLATISLDLENADSKPALLYTGTIHAREWIGIELANSFVQYIVDNHQFNPKLKQALSNNTLYIVPCLNPDGFEFSRTHFSFWRKNRRNNGDGTYGVDLNRNFGSRFKKRNDTNATTYGGPEAFSEPETRAIRDFVDNHKNITISLDYHSQGNVFFPAHKFNHEAEIDTTDLNTLCANMAHEIQKVSGTKYGIHRGKPPTNLINGSGREYYYDKGIIATVVEVGTRNIPDYMENMSQSVNENIPALVHALNSAICYSSIAPARVSNFTIKDVAATEATLEWEYSGNEAVYFEIYRNEQHKSPCTEDNLVGLTKATTFTDVQLQSGSYYYYKIRAVFADQKIAGPYAPEVKLKTSLATHHFSRTLFPLKNDIGYVGEYTLEKNREHFGQNSLFIGVNKSRGVCYGVIEFKLDKVPDDAQIEAASFSLYPLNRVGAKIENYGEWGISILDPTSVPDIRNFDAIQNATVLHTGQAIESDKLTQGVWSNWSFNGSERKLLEHFIAQGSLLIRIEGPTTLPRGHESQMMQFDIGFGRFGAGIHYRPSIELTYSRKPKIAELYPTAVNSIYQTHTETGTLSAGFDADGEKVYGQLAFAMQGMPDPNFTVITDAYLVIQNTNALGAKKDIRFSVELAEVDNLSYNSVKMRDSIQYIGYEVSHSELRDKKPHYFNFDSFARTELERLYSEQTPICFLIRATSPNRKGQNELINWLNKPSYQQPKLVIEYIERSKVPLPAPTNFTVTLEKNLAKLTWTNPKDKNFVGAFVVRNRFHPPKSPQDGVKIYGGQDEYTIDDFGNPNIPKYYSVFSYDGVPLYSSPACIYFSANQAVPVIELDPDDWEPQHDEYFQSLDNT
ncbi:M14 family zinc carboxypeptidase [Psychrosphaera sp. 1_MG-2023]|uniref:M14 family zinc carboxypeptidase n=1 Tax=Psychrosphaera sp. 1_MG-2023 TaxID=3062643 RepID=UPI0026E38D74|nr:M14 family zinc carboxypeptidase [Psychrosphaera sp. 1_MG-2023]MDO6721124.1 M14 family zinc carboxypeptidase [Psychrosphaera sp. 1_MG-2023]